MSINIKHQEFKVGDKIIRTRPAADSFLLTQIQKAIITRQIFIVIRVLKIRTTSGSLRIEIDPVERDETGWDGVWHADNFELVSRNKDSIQYCDEDI